MTGIDPAMFELFREEVRAHAAALARGLLDAEADPANPTRIEPLMRAAHSIKGACRIVGIDSGVRLAHVMEDALVAAQHGRIRLTPADIDALLKGGDLLATLGDLTPETAAAWGPANAAEVSQLEPVFVAMAGGTPALPAPVRLPADPPPPPAAPVAGPDFPPPPPLEPVAIPPDPLPLPPEHSMLDLFREELREHLLVVSGGEPDPAHESLKQIRGAARIVKCQPVERVAVALLAHVSAVREGRTRGTPAAGGWLRLAVSTLAGAIATADETFPAWLNNAAGKLAEIADVFERATPTPTPARRAPEPATPPAPVPDVAPPPAPTPPAAPPAEAVVRVTAQSLNRLMGLAGESLVQARWLPSFSTALLVLKRHHDRLAVFLDGAFHAAAAGTPADELAGPIAEARRQAAVCRAELTNKSTAFDDHAARAEDLNSRLYREVIASRMRPFGDGVHGLPRFVRDMSRALSKEVRLVIDGEQTEVDRDILDKLESPLSHLIRNAVDHGIEPPEMRAGAGKPRAGMVRLEARHRAGMLQVVVSDDGRGVDLEKLRRKIVERGLSSPEVVGKMHEPELLEFLFLPGFSTAKVVTEFSGRGVGLDVVQDSVRKVGGSVRVTTRPGGGAAFHLQLPLTLSVIRAVVVTVAGEPYAFPHTRIDRLLRVPRADVRSVEHRQFVVVDGQNVGLVVAAQLLDLPAAPPGGDDLAVVLLSDPTGAYGLVVDSFRGEQDLVVRPLDPRLGKVPNLSAAAILDDGSPVLIVDAEDLIRSMDKYIQTGSLARCDTRPAGAPARKRVLVVDDSITVREVERQLLLHKGYDVAVAVDGVDGWNKVRAEKFDLLVSDIDMPRMTGLQLVAAVRADPKLRDLPVVIVSYKEREEDRRRGLEVGANCYLTKGSFHDNRFIEAVEDLIGT
jgi:two-component system, chemotaxis family, sensor histidine kinase and response regulator WspE